MEIGLVSEISSWLSERGRLNGGGRFGTFGTGMGGLTRQFVPRQSKPIKK